MKHLTDWAFSLRTAQRWEKEYKTATTSEKDRLTELSKTIEKRLSKPNTSNSDFCKLIDRQTEIQNQLKLLQ